MQYIKAPDFPNGGIIYGYNGVKDAYETGRGRIVLRAETSIETDSKGRNIIIAHDVPYQVNKAEMIKRQAALVKEGKIEGITNIRDESDKDGIRVVYELRHDVVPNVVLNKLFQYSELQSSFGVNNIALVKGRPVLLSLKDIISHFVDHRIDVVTRRTRFELAEAESIRQYNKQCRERGDADKVVKTINAAWGGYGRGEKEAIKLMFELVDRLASVGVHTIFIGHTKQKEVSDVVSGNAYSILTCDMQNNYFNALKKKLHFLAVAYYDRELVASGKKKKVNNKDVDIKKISIFEELEQIFTFLYFILHANSLRQSTESQIIIKYWLNKRRYWLYREVLSKV